MDRIDDDVGSLDGLVNNAGIAVAGPVELVTDEEWRHQFEVNLFGVVRLTRSALPLVERAGGRFVHIGSINGRIAVPGLAPYAASKHALDAFNWALRAEVSPRTGMTSSLIEPGRVDTPIWAKARRTADDIERRLASSGTTERYRSLLDGQRVLLDQGGGVDPDRVAAVVERALTHRRPRARYLVGGDARLGGLLARLPERALEGVLALNARQLARLARRSAAASPDRGRS
ncbi:MAG: SDR family NAD(P)-dependent oxidoreductase [Actinomycetota bacterium]